MKILFDPSVVELADPRGDPNQVVAVQQKIEEMLSTTNQQRKEGLRKEIRDLGPIAMPGLINATWVWIKELQGDLKTRQVLLGLMKKFADENSAAADLLLNFGVLDAPFELPRELASKALEESSWEPTNKQLLVISKNLLLKVIMAITKHK